MKRAHKLRESRVGRPGFPIPKCLYGLCGRKGTSEEQDESDEGKRKGHACPNQDPNPQTPRPRAKPTVCLTRSATLFPREQRERERDRGHSVKSLTRCHVWLLHRVFLSFAGHRSSHGGQQSMEWWLSKDTRARACVCVCVCV